MEFSVYIHPLIRLGIEFFERLNPQSRSHCYKRQLVITSLEEETPQRAVSCLEAFLPSTAII